MKLKNLIHMGCGAFRANMFNSKIPLNVMLSVTNRCTSNCNYCNVPNRAQRELTTKEIFDLVDQIAESGAERLGLWGGEPLMREDIGQIIDYAKAKGLFVTLDSNGYLVEEKIALLKNLDHLVLAFDGPQELHDRNRGKGSFERVMGSIRLLQKKIPVLTITVLTKDNLEGVDFILETAQTQGFLTTFQVLHHNEILGKNLVSLLPPGESYRNVIRKLILKKKNRFPILSSYRYLKHLLNWPDYEKPMLSYSVGGLRCWAGRLYCNVDTDGSVYPCSLLIGKMDSLNFMDAGFKKAFEDIPEFSCRACNASCFTEYNFLYSLNFSTIMVWLKAMRMSKRLS